MPFEPGNQEAKKADRKKPKVIAQQLTSALNEAYGEGDKSKLRAVIDTWIKKAIDGDMQAIAAIADRMDGKPHQSTDMELTGADGVPLHATINLSVGPKPDASPSPSGSIPDTRD